MVRGLMTHAPSRRPARPAGTQPSRPPQETSSPARGLLNVEGVLDLQRTAGNRAVSSLIVQTERDVAAAGPSPKTPISPSGQDDLATLIARLLPLGMAAGGALDQVLRAVGADMTGTLIESLILNGYRDESKLTNLMFWMRHPDLTGQDLHRDQPGYAELSKEWLDLRATIVHPALHSPPKVSVPSTDQTGAGTNASGDQVPLGTAGDDFVKDWARSTLELLPASQRAKFEGAQWGRLDFPGTKVPLKGLADDAADWWRKEPSVIEVPGPEGYFTGANQKLAGELFYALSQVRPGGGERRVNIGPNAVIPESAFAKDPDEFYKYVTDELDGIPGQSKIQMNKEAAAKFAEMRDAARADGVRLIAMNAFRPLEHERQAEKAAGNRNAVGGISHLIGLAVDVQLHVDAKADPEKFFEAGTGNFGGMLGMMHSPVHKWIFMNGSKFGFYQYRQEPWHWEYNPPGFRDRFYLNAPDLKVKAEHELPARRK